MAIPNIFQPCMDTIEVKRRKRIYVNITILDVSEAIKQRVNQRVQKSKLPNSIRKVVAKQASNVASHRASNHTKLVENMSSKVREMIIKKMRKKGVTIEAKEVFLEGPYFVLELLVTHCDAAVLSEARHKDEQSEKSWGLAKWTLGLIGAFPTSKLESDILPGYVQDRLEDSLNEILTDKLMEKKLETIVETLPEERQARYFFATLEQIRSTSSQPPPSVK